MKNLKMSKKILLAFGAVIACFLITVVIMTVSLVYTGNSYTDFYEQSHEAMVKVDAIRIDQQELLKYAAYGAMTPDINAVQGYMDLATESANAIDENISWFQEHYNGDISLINQFQTANHACSSIRKEIEVLAVNEATIDQAIELMLGQYNTDVEASTDILLSFATQVEADAKENYDGAMAAQKALIALSVAIVIAALIITLAMAAMLIKSIVPPIREMQDVMKQVTQGNVHAQLTYKAKDELGELSDDIRFTINYLKNLIEDETMIFTEMGNGNFTVNSGMAEMYIGDFKGIYTAWHALKMNINDTLSQINQSADQVADGSDQVSSGSQALAQGATEQASSVEELAATTNEIAVKVNQNAENAKLANDKATTVKDNADMSRQRMQEMMEAIADINTKSSEVGKIIKTIEDIAFQTNILALNAAVEAARAGDAGKGFAVVADEVRSLAGKSAEASQNTSVLIEASIQAVDKGIKIANETAQSLDEVVDGVVDVSGTIGKITVASEEQASAIQQVNQGVDQISSVVQTNSATAEESAAASEELAGQAQILKELVARFKLLNSNDAYDGMSASYGSYSRAEDRGYSAASMGNDKY